mgnify:FL=1
MGVFVNTPTRVGVRCALVALLLAPIARGDDVPRVDLDDPAALARTQTAPTRARWFFEASDPAFDPNAAAAAEGVEVVARLDALGGAWILEASAADADAVEAAWRARGALRRDVSGTPALVNTTRLVDEIGRAHV